MRIVVIGGGAAGLMAGCCAAEHAETLLLEKNEKCGKKIYITGKGRCNVCNASDNEHILKNVVHNARFLYPSLSDYTANDLIQFFEEHGCPIKTERGARCYPQSDKASDITNTLQRVFEARGGRALYRSAVQEILTKNGAVSGVLLEDGRQIDCDRVIVATGGASYPTTGSTGDGYRLLAQLGHRIIEPRQALVPLNSSADWVRSLQGISLKNVELTLKQGKKILYQELGEMLFTHFGISGPLVLSASSFIQDLRQSRLYLNLKPALDADKLDKRFQREIQEAPNRKVITMLCTLYPQKLAAVMAELCDLPAEAQSNQLSRPQRRRLVDTTLALEIPIAGFRAFTEAIITQGGADCKDFVPKTMESKFIKGLYAAGELLDIDALTGGYNLFVAFVTGRRAGLSASAESI